MFQAYINTKTYRKFKSPFCAPPAARRRQRPPSLAARAAAAARRSAVWTGRAGWDRIGPSGEPWGDGLGKSGWKMRGQLLTLAPGDLIATGTPAGVGFSRQRHRKESPWAHGYSR